MISRQIKNGDCRSKMQREPDLKERIIEFWNKAGICSFDSSTCARDSYLASCDNFIESRLLEELIEKKCQSNALGIDIGAGLGRFTVVMARHLKVVHALEPGKNIYNRLVDNCRDFGNVQTFNTDFESFNIQKDYDIAVISGLFCYYSPDMVQEFFKKLIRHLGKKGMILIRDFIIKKGVRQVPSAYIEDGFCYFRDLQYWINLAKEFGLTLSQVFQSRPSYPFEKLIHLSGLSKIFGIDIVRSHIYKRLEYLREHKVIRFYGSEIRIVFMVLERSITPV